MPPDPDEPADAPEGAVLSPEELDISEDQHVHELENGRFLISPEDEPPTAAESVEELADEPPNPSAPAPELDADIVHEWLADRLVAADSRYGFAISAVFEETVVRQELLSDDVITTFENLLVWYAQHVGGDTPVEDVLGILLAESTAPVRLPPNTVRAFASTHGLDGDDRLEELYAIVDRDGGLRLGSVNDTA